METIEQKAVVDRIEDATWAVLLVGESEAEQVVPVEQLPQGVTEGTWLRVRIEEDTITEIVVDVQETDAVRGRIRAKMEALRQRKRHFRPSSAEGENVRANAPHVEESESEISPEEGSETNASSDA